MINNIIKIVVTIAIIVTLVIVVENNRDNKVKSESKVESYQSKIDSLMKNQSRYDSIINNIEVKTFELSYNIEKNNNLIEKNNKELLKFKKQYNESISNVNGYNYNQLDSFFSDRYK